ncbi:MULTISPECIES: hypothetical protein [unclassified Archaeoglobus]|jgi:predicted aldo/keto reductase-like oxidoreductase|uniref:hypothetical protein n=1 Tax=unclassified Archaeoglobus TaxID=2643606 RepID=UPI0025C33D67|nr:MULTISPECIES: hypothetical protein [unclassified Archaeoglobus]
MDVDKLISDIERWLDEEVCEYCEWSWECPNEIESCIYLKIKKLLEWVKEDEGD